jgi:hypothetical protein
MNEYSFTPKMMTWFTASSTEEKKKFTKEDLIPTKIIYNYPATTCYFKDGSKEVVKCAKDEVFVKEVGVTSCIMKKLFKSRNEFKRLVESGYEQPKREEKKSKKDVVVAKVDNSEEATKKAEEIVKMVVDHLDKQNKKSTP